MDWGEIVACVAGYYKFSHKHIKPTHTGNLLIDAHNMTHLSGFPNFPNSDRTPLFFHRPTHPTETTLGVLFYINRALEVVLNVAQNNIVGAEPLEHSIGGAATNEHCDITLE